MVALLSPEHSASIIWDYSSARTGPGSPIRKRRYEVVQTSEQKESVVTHPGFEVLLLRLAQVRF